MFMFAVRDVDGEVYVSFLTADEFGLLIDDTPEILFLMIACVEIPLVTF